MIPRRTSHLRHWLVAIGLCALGALAVACSPDAPTDQAVLHTGPAQHLFYCHLDADADEVPNPEPDTDFAIDFTITNDSTVPCFNDASVMVTGNATTRSPSVSQDTFTVLGSGGDANTIVVTAYLHSTSAGTAMVLFHAADYLDTVFVTVGSGGPSAPASPTASSVTTTGATVNWTNPGSTKFLTTHIEYRTHPSGSWSSDATESGAATSHAVTGLTSSTVYDVKLWATNSLGTSDTTPASSLFTTLPGPPLAPSSLTASSVTSSGATVDWTIGTSGSTSHIEYRTHGGGSWSTDVTPTVGATSYALTGLAPSTAYDVQMWATNSAGTSDTTPASSLFTTTTPPSPPSSLTPSSVTSSSATVGWTIGTSGATSHIEYKTHAGSTWSTDATATVGATTYPLTALTASTAYDVRMWATNSGGTSDTTVATSLFTTSALSIPAVTSFYISACSQEFFGGKNHNLFTFSWTTDPSSVSATYSWEIGASFTNDSSTAGSLTTGSHTLHSADDPDAEIIVGTTYRSFWIRYGDGSSNGPWFALSGNPILVSDPSPGACAQ